MDTNLARFRTPLLLVIGSLLAVACSPVISPRDASVPHTVAASPVLAKVVPDSDQPGTGRKADRSRSPAEAALKVTASQPSDGSVDIDPTSQIIVVFNRPVVPLTGIDEQASPRRRGSPDPLSIEPRVSGEGRWINTSVYSYQPAPALAGATRYTVTVDGVAAFSGERLTEPYVFTFTTASPTVTGAAPTGNRVAPDSAVSVQFSQPMDTAVTSRAFHLFRINGADLVDVEGRISWDEAQTTLSFTPSNALEFGQGYSINVTADAVSASRGALWAPSGRGNLRQPFTSQFSVAPYPDIVSVTPSDRATSVSPNINVVIRFNTQISRTQALQEVSVTPVLSTTRVYSYYSPYNNELTLSWPKQPQTQYTVTVGGAIEDSYGNALGDDRVFTFITGDYAPYVNLELERLTHFSAADDTRVSLIYRNIDTVRVDLYRLPESEVLKLAGGNQWRVWKDYSLPDADTLRIWRREYDTSGNPNISVRQVITITDDSGDPLPPGAYFLSVDTPQWSGVGDNSLRAQAALILSSANLVIKKSRNGPSLAWLTDLATGEPIPHTPIRFYMEGEPVGRGQTGADGSVLLKLDMPADKEWAPVIAIGSDEGEPDYALVSSDWNDGIAAWDFGLMGGWGTQQIQGRFYTDRPIYRPGDTVYWKGIIRTLVDDEYRLPPPDLTVAITVRDDMGNVVLEQEATLNDIGTVHGEVLLSPEAGTGYYYLEARLGEEGTDATFSGVDFQVASYRKPEFEISVESEQPEYVQGDTVRVAVRAQYFSGGPLVDAPVTWRLIADPYFFSWSAPAQAGVSGRRYSFSPFDPETAPRGLPYDPYRGIYSSGLVTEGSGATDADGTFVLELPADISRSLQSQNWAIDVTVQSPTNQFVSGATVVPIHRAAYYIGLAPRSYVAQVGGQAQVDLVTITPQYAAGSPLGPGATLDVTVFDFNWNSVYERAADGSYRWETSVERTPVFSTTVTTDRAGRAAIEWTPEQAGQYQVVAAGEDDAGNPTNSATFVWVSAAGADEFVSWPMKNNDRIEIIADKQTYSPGDTARILVPSPFHGPVRALVTTERAGVISAEVRTLQANSEMLEIPITEKHIPNVYVSVILAKGVDETNPFPAMRVGYVMLSVDTAEKELTVDIDAPDDQVRPGSTVTYTLRVSDNMGRPQPNAEVSAALIDKAVLSLAGADDTSMVDAFYRERPLDVVTGASLVINRDRVSQQLSEGAKGGGGGGGGGMLEVRGDFSDVAFWKADFRTDSEGQIQFQVKLPDSLTTWRLVAKAVTEDTKVGESASDVVASKELQIRPLVPRFLTAGDRPWLGAQLINTSEFTVTGVLTYTLHGARFAGGDSAYFSFTLGPGEQTGQSWPAEVSSGSDQVTVLAVAAAQTDQSVLPELRDGVRLALPVERYESPETVSSSGTVPPGGTVEEILLGSPLGPGATDTGSLQVRIEPSLASGMLEGLNYLQNYPYECNEQIVSRFLPNLVTVRALDALDIDDTALKWEPSGPLSYQLGIGAQRLVSRQNPDGGWGYWPGEESSPFISAYVLWGIALADEQGFAVPPATLASAIAYLDGQFQAPHATLPSWQLNEMAFMHFVLSELDAGDPGRASTLYDVRENLGIYGKSLLAMALDNMSESSSPDPRVQTLLDDILGATVLSATGAHWQETDVDYWTLNTDTRSTSIALAALARLRPDQPILPQTVRWLMVARDSGRWASTQENAWAIIGLTDWLLASRELEGDYEWGVTLNGEEMGRGTVTPDEVNRPVELSASVTELLKDEVNVLAFARTGNKGQLYYTTHFQYFLDATAIDSRDRGIVVGRRFAALDDDSGRSISSAEVGDVISVTITIVAPTDLHQVLVEAPIPAGTEPIDPRLAVTERQFRVPNVSVADDMTGGGWWRRWVPTHTDYRDDKVALFATYLPAGTYEYTFNVRASVPGEYRVLPAYAEMMYFNEVWGRSAGALFTVTK